MTKLDDATLQASATTTEPPDFNEGGKEYRRNILVSTSLAIIILSATSFEPELLGIKIPAKSMWFFLGVAHIYFFLMWRLTSAIENDRDKQFWNFRGMWKQATFGGTENFPGKTKAQIILIRALPIWMFLVGLMSIGYGLVTAFLC